VERNFWAEPGLLNRCTLRSRPAGRKPEGSTATRVKTSKFRDDQIKTVRAAIDRAKNIAGVEDDSAALAVICEAYADGRTTLTPLVAAGTGGQTEASASMPIRSCAGRARSNACARSWTVSASLMASAGSRTRNARSIRRTSSVRARLSIPRSRSIRLDAPTSMNRERAALAPDPRRSRSCRVRANPGSPSNRFYRTVSWPSAGSTSAMRRSGFGGTD